jgi:hypothetical protein
VDCELWIVNCGLWIVLCGLWVEWVCVLVGACVGCVWCVRWVRALGAWDRVVCSVLVL